MNFALQLFLTSFGTIMVFVVISSIVAKLIPLLKGGE